ncbi:MAG: bifunctional (p)ppGpp synthetase/guanosine-3',5'-bis(diphosphate) 3'-pyrophosphohydrolase [Blastocatellia bacterium]|nr:bifunctional (p)ppGpp synthetase/guanosine-3',5'-bis(diphosphate) 3'-pyrophosphohydrolase [Blastocatellia bacterium]
MSLLLTAIKFSADKHRNQRRKGADASPYINHPIDVADILWRIGSVREMPTILAAILHDTLEDTDATPAEIAALFGNEVLALVEEVTDNKALPKDERKRLQVVTAQHKSTGAKLIKLADKISNITELGYYPPVDWSHERRLKYLEWSDDVILGLRGVNAVLEEHYDETVRQTRKKLADRLTVTD